MGSNIFREIYYNINSGKKSKLAYYATNTMRQMVPGCLLRALLPSALASAAKRDDYEYMQSRIDYYCKLRDDSQWDASTFDELSAPTSDLSPKEHSAYYYDIMRYARWFPSSLRWVFLPGDITDIPAVPALLKSRPIGGDNKCSVLMKLNTVRHFIFVNDRRSWSSKLDKAVFRGGLGQPSRRQSLRKPFVEKYFGHPMFDIGVSDKHFPEWHKPKMTIREQLNYKFVVSLEGNEVASNLKWIMSSNSIAVMPRPQYETWFMEGRLIPNYHYIEIKPDYSDAAERMAYYIEHPEEAEQIIRHAHEYVAQFKDSRRELLISLHVLNRYFRLTNANHWK